MAATPASRVTAHAEPPIPVLTGWRLALAAFALALTNFVVVLDITIANVSVPHIAGGLAVSPTQGTWVITSYAVAEAITVPLSGWLAARFGTVRWLIISIAGFGLFSLLCGIAGTIELLILFRILQGLSGGPLMPLTQAMLTRIFPPDKIPMAMGLWAVTTILAPIVGPILGGTISDTLSWPWIFFINVPVVIGCLVVFFRYLSPFESVIEQRRIDRVGLVLLILWVGAFQLMLDTGREHDWFGSPMIVSLAIVAAIAFIAFIIWEWFDEDPVVDLQLLRDRTLAVSIIAISIGYGSFFGSVVLVPLWLQAVLGYTASQAGWATAALGVLAVMVAPVAAALLNRVDARLTICLGMVWMGLMTLVRLDWNTGSTMWDLVWPMLLQGLGMPFFFVGLTTLGIINVTPERTAAAAGIMSFMRTVSGAIATAVATTLWANFASTSRTGLAPLVGDGEATLAGMQAGGMTSEQARTALSNLAEAQASTIAMLDIFMVTTAMFMLAAAIVWLIPRPTGALSPGGGMGH
ncbi:DHA2 family efflux MFS transporter permease subunit [Sphingomonas lacunae]|uniref:DHA2 family efflux MFS transporter permease subunit n=1 Tax=Sphingomonas lacunae TaxID=2698828 RepID=A0A6M4AR64_9SPHN|nr:DHA2 family efflux MFS transporter permease subunit [Sphingomonas lacunae]QJQ31535.1 DHA2 family efflux MFS transporter permease subunit [Sphingomonas lacunae]